MNISEFRRLVGLPLLEDTTTEAEDSEVDDPQDDSEPEDQDVGERVRRQICKVKKPT